MKPQEPEEKGPVVVSRSRARPAIKIEAMEWANDDPSIKWTDVYIGKKSRLIPKELERSETPMLAPAVELLLQTDPAADAMQLALGLFEVIDAVNKLDLALGGTGLIKTSAKQTNGTVTITLAAQQQAGAGDRIRQICEQINQTKEMATEWKIPAVVKTIQRGATGRINWTLSPRRVGKSSEILMKLSQVSRLFSRVRQLVTESHGDFSDVLKALPSERMALGGGLAVALHGHVRTTQDIDVFVPNVAGLESLIAAAVATGVFRRTRTHALEHIEPGIVVKVINPEFVKSQTIGRAFALGDIENRDGVPIFCLRALLAIKVESNCPQDIADVVALTRINGAADLSPYGETVSVRYEQITAAIEPTLKDRDV